MKKIVYVLILFFILLAILFGYVIFTRYDATTALEIDEKCVRLLGDTMGMDEMNISIRGTYVTNQFDSDGSFFGEIRLDDMDFNFSTEDEGLILNYNEDENILWGHMMTKQHEAIRVVFSADFKTGSFRFEESSALMYYPYNGERLMTIKDIVEAEFKKVIKK